MPLATATADPPLDPPATRLSSIGLRLAPYIDDSVDEPIPNSSMLVFPTTIPPAALIFATTSAS